MLNNQNFVDTDLFVKTEKTAHLLQASVV